MEVKFTILQLKDVENANLNLENRQENLLLKDVEEDLFAKRRRGRPRKSSARRRRGRPRKSSKKSRKWMQKASKSMKKRGTVGAFTRQAKRAGMGVQEYARHVIKKYKGKTKNARELQLLRRAVFARNAGKARH